MEIPLTQGKVAIVDDADADQAAMKWYASPADKTFYAKRNISRPVRRSYGGPRTESIHQVIARRMGIVGPPDHKDRNGLNNRRENLRQDPGGLNSVNKGRRSDNTSGYKGVSWHKRLAKWRAYIQIDGRSRHLGLFVDQISAAKAYDRAALDAWGEFAVLNFPETRSL